MGRFISEDPIRDGLNWYEYCGNNPVMFNDPLGLKPGDITSLAGCSDEQRDNIDSAQSAYQGGYITLEEYARNAVLNGAQIEKLPAITVSKTNHSVTITAHVTITLDKKELPYKSDEYKQAIINGIEEEWSGSFKGYKITTNVIVEDNNNAFKAIEITMDKAENGKHPKTNPFGTIKLYDADKRQENEAFHKQYTLDEFKKVAAHEFGHSAFGMFDVYEISEFKDSVDSIMNDHRVGSQSVDFEMMLASKVISNSSPDYTSILRKYKRND